MQKLIHIINKHYFFILLYIVLMITVLIPYYIGGTLILGGEGDYVLDFSTYLSGGSFMWSPTNGVGIAHMSLCGTGLNIFLLYLIEKFTSSVSTTNFVLIFSIYFFPFFAMYLVCKELKTIPFICFITSFFYVFNPFMLNYLASINQWGAFSITVMPLFLWLIMKYYYSNFKLFFLFGFISACFSFAYTNPPMLAIIHISIILSMFIVSYYRNKKLILSQIFKKYSIVLVSFLVFNSWWILSFFGGAISTAQKAYSYGFAKSWLDITVRDRGAIIAKMFTLRIIDGSGPSHSFFPYWYGTVFAKLITLIPIFIIIYFVLIVKDKRTRNPLNCAILGALLIILFFVKGNSGLFGFIYSFMFRYVPFFYIFKTPVEKFGLLYVFILSVLLLFIMIGIKGRKHHKSILGIFTAYLIFCSAPIITGNIIPDSKLSNGMCVSRKYKDKPEYKQVREEVNNDSFQYRILSMPGVGNYQVLLPNYNNKYYIGLDPVLTNTNKPIIATQYYNIELLYENITLANYRKLFGIYNIGKIIINEDLIPWFGTLGIGDVAELKKIFSKFMTAKTLGPIIVYDNKDDFLPHIYPSIASSIVNGDMEALVPLTETRYLVRKPLLLFTDQLLETRCRIPVEDTKNLIFKDSNWQDLAVEFATQSTVHSLQSAVKIEKDGVYELWIDYPRFDTEKKRVAEWEIKVDGKPWVLNTGFWLLDNKGRKYIKLGGGDLKAGKHIIKSKIQNPKSQNQEIKLILVNKQERQRAEKIIWQKMNEQGIDIAYIFSQDGKFYSLEGKSYTLKVRLASALTESKKNIDKILANKPLLKIDGRQLFLNDFSNKKGVFDSQGFWLELENLNLAIGEHKIELLNSDNFNVNLIIIEPVTNNQKQLAIQEPKISFKKINPTKYLVEVKDARNPFWLVFSESFHNEWRLYKSEVRSHKSKDEFMDIVADYPKLKIKEAKHEVRFTPFDIKYLFRKSITDNHYLVNGYANGWYIEPKELGLDKDFTLVLYFWPQSLFYLGLGISGLTFLGCIGYLIVNFIKDKLKG